MHFYGLSLDRVSNITLATTGSWHSLPDQSNCPTHGRMENGC